MRTLINITGRTLILQAALALLAPRDGSAADLDDSRLRHVMLNGETITMRVERRQDGVYWSLSLQSDKSAPVTFWDLREGEIVEAFNFERAAILLADRKGDDVVVLVVPFHHERLFVQANLRTGMQRTISISGLFMDREFVTPAGAKLHVEAPGRIFARFESNRPEHVLEWGADRRAYLNGVSLGDLYVAYPFRPFGTRFTGAPVPAAPSSGVEPRVPTAPMPVKKAVPAVIADAPASDQCASANSWLIAGGAVLAAAGAVLFLLRRKLK